MTFKEPELARNLAEAKLHLDQLGYAVIPSALDAQTIRVLQTTLVDIAAHEKSTYAKNSDAGGNQRILFLINKGKVFTDLLLHSVTSEMMRHVLGDNFLLSSLTANIANPGGVIEFHTDQWWLAPLAEGDKPSVRAGSVKRADFRGRSRRRDAAGGAFYPAVTANVIWLVNDFTVENGATLLVPGSHLSGDEPDIDLKSHSDVVAAVAPAGSALVIDGRLWHSTGANVGPAPRIGILSYFCGPQYRQQEVYTVGTAPEVLAEASPQLLELLGFRAWNGYGYMDDGITPSQRLGAVPLPQEWKSRY